MKLSDYPPGSSVHRYRATPEEIEELRRMLRIQRERDERPQRQLIDEREIRPDTESDEKTA